MRLSNSQLRLLVPVVLKAARENPSPDWDKLLNDLAKMAALRGDRQAFQAEMAKDLAEATQQRVDREKQK